MALNGSTLAGAVEGSHPCGVCIKVQRDAQSRKNAESRAPERTLDLTTTSNPSCLSRLAPIWTLSTQTVAQTRRTDAIDLPPPRLLQD